MKHLNNSHGAVAVMIALLMFIFLGFAAFAVDLGMVWVANKQLQNAADAGALAGARALGYYACKAQPGATCQTLPGVITTGTPNQAVTPTVIRVVGENSAVSTPSLNIDDTDSDVQIAWWYQNDWHNGPPAADPSAPVNAVSVTVRKEQKTTNDAVDAFFGKILNVNEYNLNKNSIAALTGLGKVEPGELVPLAISTQKECNLDIFLNGKVNSCAGWTTLDTNYSDKIVQDLFGNPTATPAAWIGKDINVKGGVVTKNLEALEEAFNSHPHPWNVLVPVYDESNPCKNPSFNMPYKIIGFATFSITSIIPTGGEKGVYGKLQCGIVNEGQGGGGDYGTLGTIPGLVR